MDIYPEDNLSDLESEEETESEDESEDEFRENLEFNFGQVRLDSVHLICLLVMIRIPWVDRIVWSDKVLIFSIVYIQKRRGFCKIQPEQNCPPVYCVVYETTLLITNF